MAEKYSVLVNEQNQLIGEDTIESLPSEEDSEGFSLFGFRIVRDKKKKAEPISKKSFVPPQNMEDGEEYIQGPYGGRYSGIFDVNSTVYGKNEFDLITRYREAAQHPECDAAIEDIIDQAIVGAQESKAPVAIVTDEVTEGGAKMKKALQEEFEVILQLLDFNTYAHDIVRKWYIDGRLFHHIVIDMDRPEDGIQELRPIDALHIKKVKELIKEKDPNSGVEIIVDVKEFFVYNNPDLDSGQGYQYLEIAADTISYVTSGLLDPKRKQVHSYLHKALKAVNQLRTMEDSLVIYRITRAPERRVFYIDVGNLPRNRAEQYLQGIMDKHRTQVTYDVETGDVASDRKHLSMIDDFWLPRKEGGQGTEIDTLSGGENLGEIEDIVYFQKKLYKSLNVPLNRLEQEDQFTLGRTSEITREELKFSKFIGRLRKKFAALFFDLLGKQMILKGHCTFEEWEIIKNDIYFEFVDDIYFAELKEAEILQERLNIANEIQDFIGRYYSHSWVRKNVLYQTDVDIKQMDKEIKEEQRNPQYNEDYDEDDYVGGFGGGGFNDDEDDEEYSGFGHQHDEREEEREKEEREKEREEKEKLNNEDDEDEDKDKDKEDNE